MKAVNFQLSAHAKCILAGEHAVLQGSPALVSPIHQMQINLAYEKTPNPINIICTSPFEEIFLIFFWNTLHRGLKLLKRNISELKGNIYIENNIPMGGGIGFSSALCLIVSKLFIKLNWLSEEMLFDFSRKLENLFHKESSGVDILGALVDHVVHYEKSGKFHDIKLNWQPKLYFSFSGATKLTSKAIKKVEMLNKTNHDEGIFLTQKMQNSVLMMESALQKTAHEGLPLFIQAMNNANECFERWKLITPEMHKHMQTLKHLGAIASKPTGAGGGGYILSLWDRIPPENSSIELDPLILENAHT